MDCGGHPEVGRSPEPWLTTGPEAPAAYKDLAALGKVNLLLVTHVQIIWAMRQRLRS
jgi:hypothetical protein